MEQLAFTICPYCGNVDVNSGETKAQANYMRRTLRVPDGESNAEYKEFTEIYCANCNRTIAILNK